MTEAHTVAEAMAALGKAHDVIIFGHQVPEHERNQIAALAKQTYPRTRVIMLYLGAIRRAELADALLNVTGKPEGLRHAIEILLADREQAPGSNG